MLNTWFALSNATSHPSPLVFVPDQPVTEFGVTSLVALFVESCEVPDVPVELMVPVARTATTAAHAEGVDGVVVV
jgi:hypothetical protein